MEEAQQGGDSTESLAAVTLSTLTGSHLSKIAAQQVNGALCSPSPNSRINNTCKVNQLLEAMWWNPVHRREKYIGGCGHKMCFNDNSNKQEQSYYEISVFEAPWHLAL